METTIPLICQKCGGRLEFSDFCYTKDGKRLIGAIYFCKDCEKEYFTDGESFILLEEYNQERR